jgi:hypothetical protein
MQSILKPSPTEATIQDWNALLDFDAQSFLPQFDDQTPVVNGFEKTGPRHAVNGNGAANDLFAQVVQRD